MKRRTKIMGILIMAAVLLGMLSVAHARDVSLVTVDWEPYYGSKMKNYGVTAELAAEAFKRVGHNATFGWYPWKRSLKMVADGKKDIVMGAYISEERKKTYIFSDPLFNVDVGIIVRKDVGITEYSSLKDLTQYKIGVSNGWTTTPEFDTADYLNKDYAHGPVNNMKKLFAKRVDMLAMSVNLFKFELSKDPKHDMSEVVVLKPLLASKQLYIMMGRAVPDHKEIMAAFNRGLKEIRADGTYDKIMAKHGF